MAERLEFGSTNNKKNKPKSKRLERFIFSLTVLTILIISTTTLLLGKKLQVRSVETTSPIIKEDSIKQEQIVKNPENAVPPIEYTGTSIPIFMYHEIGTGPNSLYVPTEDFRDQMKYLYDNGYHPVTMSNAQEMLTSGKIPAKTVVLTFDDGYTSIYGQAWPILKEFGFTGTVYVITDFLDKPNYLTWEELKTLTSADIEIGSHTINHLDLGVISIDAQKQEINGSKKELEEKLNISVKSFCYPCGAYSEITPQLVKEAGYTSAVTTVYGSATSEDYQFLISRIRVPGWSSLDQFAGSFE